MIYFNNDIYFPYKYNEKYYVSKTGKILSSYEKGKQGKTNVNNLHELKYGIDKYGYKRVVLSNCGKKEYLHIHTIMMRQFVGDMPKNMVINHKDGNKQNNSIDNLEFVTPRENTIHAHKMRLCSFDKPASIIFNNIKYDFNSKSSCINFFPDLSIHYLNQIENNKILSSMLLFKLNDNKIEVYYNGSIYKKFNSMSECDKYFDYPKGFTFSALRHNLYRKRVNKYKVIFTNVSTIENTDLLKSGN